jgi:4-amino-4-deoxy-L-arabinose transferase-like glycosyltransferase
VSHSSWRVGAVLGYLALLYAFRLFVIAYVPLAPDEAHYWWWSQYPQLSYYDHPPMVAWIMALFTRLGGDGELFVRLGGLLCNAVGLVFLYLTARIVGRCTVDAAWEVLFVVNVTLLYAAGALVQTPDSPLVLFWAIALYCGARIVTGGAAGWWYALGLAVGLGLLSKYTMILAAGCHFLFVLLSPRHRHWLRRKDPYLAMLLAGAVFSPVIVWNLRHDWISFGFQLGQGLGEFGRSPWSKLAQYVVSQIGVVTPLLFLAFVLYSLRGTYLAFRARNPEHLYLASMSWPILVFFGVSSLRGEPAAGNWPAPAYLAGLTLMWAVFRQTYRGRRWHRAFMGGGLALALILNLAVHIHLLRPILPVPVKADTLKQFYGWEELGETINHYIDAHPSDRGYFLVAERITTVAEAVYYTRRGLYGIVFTIPEQFLFLPEFHEMNGKDAIILLNGFDDERLERFEPYFEELELLGENSHLYRGEPLERLRMRIVRGRGFRGNWRPEVPS